LHAQSSARSPKPVKGATRWETPLEIRESFQHDSKDMRRSRFVCIALALCATACPRGASERESPPPSGKPSAAPSVRSSAPSGVVERRAPPVTPALPPELVACGDGNFYRITQKELEIFEVAQVLPPPQIRGSRIARKTTEVTVDEPLAVVSTAKKGALVIAKRGVFRFELGQTRAQSFAPIPVQSPLVAWPDPRRADSFHVRTLADRRLLKYTLPSVASVDSDASPPAKVAEQVSNLTGFDGRLFTVLADGEPLYSTPKGLVRGGDESRPLPLLESSGPATLLFADASPDRHWTAGASGHLALWDRKQGDSPIATPTVPGVVIDAAQEGERVAVLSMELVENTYQPTVTIFSHGKEQGRLHIGRSIGAREQPKLDLCLVPGRPWVVVGGMLWVQLLDWESRRLLAEW